MGQDKGCQFVDEQEQVMAKHKTSADDRIRKVSLRLKREHSTKFLRRLKKQSSTMNAGQIVNLVRQDRSRDQ